MEIGIASGSYVTVLELLDSRPQTEGRELTQIPWNRVKVDPQLMA